MTGSTKTNFKDFSEENFMTVLTRWDPYREFNTVQERLNSLFNASFNEGRDESLATSSFAPAVDVYEDEHNVTLKIEVPGIDEKDIDVRIENNTLTVHGERKIEKEEKEENYRRVERQYGSFTRTFNLPPTVDAEKVQADYDKGVLKVTLPKKAEAKGRSNRVLEPMQGGWLRSEPQAIRGTNHGHTLGQIHGKSAGGGPAREP